jgi:hypothetical protein
MSPTSLGREPAELCFDWTGEGAHAHTAFPRDLRACAEGPWQNSPRRRAGGKRVGVLRLALGRCAPSHSLRMTVVNFIRSQH